MASGSYAQRPQVIQYREAPNIRRENAETLAPPSLWLKPWLLYPTGVLCVLVVLLGAGTLSQHQPSYILTSGQSYSVQANDQAITPTTQVQSSATPYTVVAPP